MADDIITLEEVIVKVNSKKNINNNEFKIMKDLLGKKGFAKVLARGMYHD